MPTETNKDSTAIMTGKHTGVNSSSFLYDRGENFDVLVPVGVVVYNTTSGTNGLVTSTTEDKIYVDGVAWDTNDEYETYLTAEKESYISSIKITKVLGKKWSDYYTDDDEQDLPEDVFGPGQPEQCK